MSTFFGPQPVFSGCMHRHIKVIYNGHRTFYGGEVCDNIQEQVLCLDCYEILSETDVRGAWNGYASKLEDKDGIR